jgi:hypothetical protein
LPSGYQIVTNTFSAPDDVQTHGYATCPGNKVPSGGGAFVESGSVGAAINSSYPSGHYWEADVNNASGLGTEFTVYAVCISPSSSYTIVTASGTTGLGMRDAAINCPVNHVVLGGGFLSDTTSLDVNGTTSTPYGLSNGHNSGWEVFMDSGQSTPTNYTVYAVCRSKPLGWSLQTGAAVNVYPGAQAEASVTCPGASVPIGGGVYTSFNTTAEWLDINSSNPSTNSWVIYENNDESVTYSATASAICAGT